MISISQHAHAPAINIVRLPIKIIVSILNSLKRRRRYTPAVTNVEEWTKALTGVGAAIAEGSHEEKGICALFVIDVNSKINVI